MDYVLHTAVLLSIYVIMACALNLLMGTAGIFSVAVAALLGIGAYASALASLDLGISPFVTTLLAMALAGLFGLFIGLFSLRLAGPYLMVGSFAFQLLAQNVFLNWREVTEGFRGIAGIPTPQILDFAFDTPATFLVLSFPVAAVCVWAAWRWTHSPYGRLLRAIRDDEMSVRALGYDTRRIKLSAFTIQGVLTGLAGAVYAHYTTFVSSGQFTVDLSIVVITAIVLGGLGSVPGSVVGAAIIVLAPNVLRFAQVPSGQIGFMQAILYGGLLLLLVFVRPSGLFRERRTTTRARDGTGRAA